MKEPIWLSKEAVLLLHAGSLARFGGTEGIRDEGLLESALARARNILAYKPKADLADLAASYAFGFTKNHGFIDGNKRAALMACGLFMARNGYLLEADPGEAAGAILSLSGDAITEAQFAHWGRLHSVKNRARR